MEKITDCDNPLKIDFYPERDPDFPHVVVDDAIGAPVYLELDAL